MNGNVRALICMLLATAASPAFAQNSDVADNGQRAEPPAPSRNNIAPEAPADTDTSSGGVGDIIVTAQRRGENLQKVPISVTALTATTLETAGVTTTADIGRVTPGFQFQQAIGLAAPYIRGIGAAGQQAGYESSVATYVDGVYLAGGASALTTLNNIERIEVLKGPQGTLFGRNASGGLVNIITKDPSFSPQFQAGLTYDEWQTITASAYVASGLTDNMAGDLAVRYSHQGKGWGRNILTGQDVNQVDHDFSIRSKVLIDISDSSKLKIAADYSDTLASTFVTFSPLPNRPATGGYLFPGGAWDSTSSLARPFRHSKGWGISADYTQDLGFASLHSITAYRDSKFSVAFDAGALPVPTVTIDGLIKQKQFSQELQLLAPDDSAFKWIVGAFYFRGDSGGSENNPTLYPLLTSAPGPIAIAQDASNVVNSVAGYAQGTYPVTDRLNLTAGIRFTYDRYVYHNTTTTNLTFVPPQFGGITTTAYPDRRGSTAKPSWRLAADYSITPSALVYASYNRGFKSGGFDVQTETGSELKPEIVDAFEVGVKLDAFDRKVRFNASAYYQTADNLQLILYFNGVSNIRNAASARAYGAEVELTVAPFQGLTLKAAGSYLNSRFKDFSQNAPISNPLPGGGNTINPNGNASGNQTPRTPDKTLTLSANYETDLAGGKIGLNGSWFRSARWYGEPDLRLFQPAYSLVAGEISWTEPSGHVRFRVFGRNLTNSKVAAQVSTTINADVRYMTEPRTIGGGVEVKF
ncbi:TonB-dependent receptor [Sphingobium phenoxybenzoativorans]|uniref:TonB-dependent receptor n=1 Tax=Sphingobium phenoxybenzoativorans TaxID=1592790 RepID=UPI000872869E|nr:TonB-dependent receptor [Sphingobium phenoxybenzoativorans]